MSVSAGGRRCRRVYRWINARYWPCLGVKVFVERLTSASPFGSDVRKSACCKMIQTSEPGHSDHAEGRLRRGRLDEVEMWPLGSRGSIRPAFPALRASGAGRDEPAHHREGRQQDGGKIAVPMGIECDGA